MSHALSKLGFTNIIIVNAGDKFDINDMTLEIEEAGKPYNTLALHTIFIQMVKQFFMNHIPLIKICIKISNRSANFYNRSR